MSSAAAHAESIISGVSSSNIIYTALIFLNHFAFGISSNIIWPALVDLGHIYNDSDNIFLAATFSSAGYTIGSLSGFLYKFLNRQLTISIMLLITAFTIAFMPFYPTIIVFFIAITLNGAGGGTWDSNNNVWLSEIWKESSITILQFSQFMYGVGTIVGPIIISPYVHGNHTHNNNQTWTTSERQDDLKVPFAITSFAQSIIPFIFLVLFLINRYNKPDTVTSYEIAPTEEKNESNKIHYRLTKILLMGLCLAAYGATEISYFYFSSTMFQYLKPISFTAEEAAHISSILSAAYTAGRLITAFISMKLSPDVIIVYHYAIIAISFVLLYLGRAKRFIIYGGTVLLGYGFSAMWPAILAFTAKYIQLNDRSGAFIFFLDGFACLLTPFMISPYLETNASSLFIFLGSYLIISLFIFVALRILIAIK